MVRFIVFIFLVFLAHFSWALFSGIQHSEPVAVAIEEGWSVEKILDVLKDKKLLKNVVQSKVYLAVTHTGNRLQAGDYIFNGAVSPRHVLQRIIRGESQSRERTVTIIEGWTLDDIASYLAAEGLMQKDDFIQAARKSYSFDITSSKPRTRISLEGYLFPDTYRIYDDSTAEELIKKMIGNLEGKITDDMKRALAAQGRTMDDAIILASILEREVRTFDDKRNVADIFLKRLQAGIALQADSTVNYITGKKSSRASADDIHIDSPYNTYKYRGLPPGPISNPGIESIEAAIYPEKNDFYYFLTTPNGEVLFSRTLDEHNMHKAEYY